MASIGDRLRDARTRHGLGFDDVEAATKIRARYLRALEAEQFDLLPGPTFARTFLRTYGDFLGLDARLLVEEYRTHHEPRNELFETHATPVPGGGRARERPSVASLSAPRPLALLGGGALAVVSFLLVLGLVAGEPGPETPPAPPPADEAAERSRERRQAPRRPPPRPRPAPTSVSLRIVPSEPTYVCLEDGQGTVRYEGVMTGPRRFRAKRLRINLGKRSVRLEANGRRVRFDEEPATPIAFDLRPRGPRKLPSGIGLCT